MLMLALPKIYMKGHMNQNLISYWSDSFFFENNDKIELILQMKILVAEQIFAQH